MVATFLVSLQAFAADFVSGPGFTIEATVLRQMADSVPAQKNNEATVLLNDLHFTFDASGKLSETRHVIYRIENQEGVRNWSETSGRW